MSQTATESLATIIVRRLRILTTNLVVFTAWQRCDSLFDAGQKFSTITEIDGDYFGRLGTERLPAELEALAPRSAERWDRVTAWQHERYEASHQAILAAEPDARDGWRSSMGEITITVGGIPA